MKYIFYLLLLTSCTKFPQQNIGIIHDYIFENANKMCKLHSGLHYIVSVQTIESEYSKPRNVDFKDYPCTQVYKVRCQDQILFEINDGIAWCFIPQAQLRETLK